MTIKNAMELLTLVENQLGWVPDFPANLPRHRVRTIAAARVNREIAKKPDLYSWRNLELAVALMRKEHRTAKSPMVIFHYVQDAIKKANVVEHRPVGELIDAAVEHEVTNQEPGWEQWRDRLVRAFGGHRQQVYAEWREARGAW